MNKQDEQYLVFSNIFKSAKKFEDLLFYLENFSINYYEGNITKRQMIIMMFFFHTTENANNIYENLPEEFKDLNLLDNEEETALTDRYIKDKKGTNKNKGRGIFRSPNKKSHRPLFFKIVA